MADLTDLQAAGTTKIVGSDATGLETTAVKASANGDLNVEDILDQGGVHGVLSVGTTPVAVRVGASNLANRKRLTFINNSTATALYYGFSNTVSAATGFPIFRNQPVSDAWGPNTTVWIVAASGSGFAVPVNETA